MNTDAVTAEAVLTEAVTTATQATWGAHLDDRPVTIAVGPAAIAVVGGEGEVLIVNACGVTLGTATIPVGGLVASWSPDGRLLALGGPTGAAIWTLDTGLTPLPQQGWCGALAWFSDGRLAAATDRVVNVYSPSPDTATLELSWQTPAVDSTVTGVAWLRDGRELAVAAYGGVRCFTQGKSKPARRFDYVGSLLDIAASSDGRWLVSGNQDASVHIWRTRDGDELEMSGFPGKVSAVEFHSAGRWLYADGGDQPTIWDFAGTGPGGRQPAMLQLRGLVGSTRFAWHPTEPLIAAADSIGEISLWDPSALAAGELNPPHVTVTSAGEPVTALAWFNADALIVATESGGIFFLGR